MDMNSYESMANVVADILQRVYAAKADSQLLRLARALRTESAKAVSDLGFDIVKNDASLDHSDRSTSWWASQALKKFRGYGTFDQDRLSKEATSGFLQRNSSLKGQRLPWFLRDEVRRLLCRALPYVSEGTGRFGPGAVAEGLDAVHRWTVFEDCDFCPREPALPGSSTLASSGFLSLPSPRPDRAPDDVARLVAVPKDAWRMRLISVEPARNSYLQQYVRSLMLESIHNGCLRGTPSDFLSKRDNVEIQQLRCVHSSKSLRTVTIDLKDASDHISAEDVFDLFPPWLIPWLEVSRTPYVRGPSGVERLWMYGGMGNATTFLVETLYFWAVFTAIGLYLGVHAGIPVSVFGDDIILNTVVAQHGMFEYMLEQCHIILNRDKSCYQPGCLFREACGVAAYDGRPLPRLIRIQAPGFGRKGKVHVCDLANRLHVSPIYACRSLSDEIFLSQDESAVRCTPMTQSDPVYGSEEAWESAAIGCFLRRDGEHPATNPNARYLRRYQSWWIKTDRIVGSNRCYWRRSLTALEALAVIGSRIQTVQRGRRTGLICPRPYHERIHHEWVRLEV